MIRVVFIAFFFFVISTSTSSPSNLEIVYRWSKINYTASSIENLSEYDMHKAVPLDFEKSKDGRMFITLVAKKEVPISLTTIKSVNRQNRPRLIPYPDQTWFLDSKNCSNITNVRTITIDKCNRLWALDTGRIENKQLCNASLLVFDLATNKLVERYIIPRHVSTKNNAGVLLNPVLKFRNKSCDVDNIYIADAEGMALIVWINGTFVRLNSPYFGPDTEFVNFTISNETFKLPGGINKLDFGPSEDILFFTNLASHNFSVLNTNSLPDILNNKSKLSDIIESRRIFRTQVTAFCWSPTHNVFFFGLTNNAIDCAKAEFSMDEYMDTTVTDSRLNYISNLKIYQNSETREEELWILSINLQKVIKKTIQFEETNYRILKVPVKDLISNTKCANSFASYIR